MEKRKTIAKSNNGCSLFLLGVFLLMALVIIGLSLWVTQLMGLFPSFNEQSSDILSIESISASQAALDLQLTQIGLQQTATSINLTQIAINTPNGQAISTSVPNSTSVTDDCMPESQGTVVIDDYFHNTIDASIWEYDGAQWAIDGTTLLALHGYSWLITQQNDFENYVVEVCMEYISQQSQQKSALINIGLNLREQMGVTSQVTVTVPFQGNSIARGLLSLTSYEGYKIGYSYYDGIVRDHSYNWLTGTPVPGSNYNDAEINTINFDSELLYVSVQVAESRFVTKIDGNEVSNMVLLSASPRGAIGFNVGTGVRIYRIRISQI